MVNIKDEVAPAIRDFKNKFSIELRVLFGLFVCLFFIILATSFASVLSGRKIDWFGVKRFARDIPKVYNVGHSPGYEKVEQIEKSGKIPQFVVFSFDGSKSLSMWKDTMDFSSSLRNNGAPLSFTYFINAVYFLSGDDRFTYTPPQREKGSSNIGFAESVDDINGRVSMINKALKDGHEIGSHTAGHFDGTFWNENEWSSEFNSFNWILAGTDQRLSKYGKKSDSLLLNLDTVKGFRAPLLGINHNLYKVLNKSDFRYDASKIFSSATWPVKDKEGIWQFPLNTVYFNNDPSRGVLGMDYSMYVVQTGAQDTLTAGTPEWNSALNDVKKAWLGYFNRSYEGDKAPISIANHFSRWNDGLYWSAVKDVALEICGKPDVYCGTYRDLYMYLDAKPTVKASNGGNSAASAIGAVSDQTINTLGEGLGESVDPLYRVEFHENGADEE